MMFSRKIFKRVEHGKRISPSKDRASAGVAHIIIPNDIDREVYIRQVFDTGRCIVVTTFDDPIRNVILPKHLIQEVDFPLTADRRGSLVTWMNIPELNQVAVNGIVLEEDQFNPFKENVNARSLSSGNFNITRTYSIKDNSYLLSIQDESGEDGSIQLKAVGNLHQAKIELGVDGTIKIESDASTEMFVEESLLIQVGSGEDEISTISISREGVLTYLDRYGNRLEIKDGEVMIDTELIKLGESAEEKAVLGDTLKEKLEALYDSLIQHTHPTAMGPSGPPINVDQFTEQRATLPEILSELVILE